MQLTKNILRGDEITNPIEIVILANERKSVALFLDGKFFGISPAAVIQNWSIILVSRWKIYKTVHAIKNSQ